MNKKIKKILIDIAKKNVFLRELMYSTRTKILKKKYLKNFYNKYEVNDKLCVFESFNGRKYSDSPKAIYLRMLEDKKYKDYHFVWAFANPENFCELNNNPRTTVVKYGSDEYKKIYATAKYWFTPSRLPDYIVPKENQIYCQFWHGTPLKRLGFDIKTKGMNAMHTVKDWQRMYQYDASRYTYMVSPSKFTSEKYRSAFNLKAVGKENCILETGYPRNDALFKYTEKDIKKIKKDLGIPKDKKVILYAPTWRDNQHQAGVGYTYELGIDFDKFQKKFKDEYVILFTVHYLVASRMDLSKYDGFIINVSDYPDLNDLYIVSDMIITDYSSVFFDYANLKRPMLFYMYDLEIYKGNMRDFYFDLKELPGPIVEKEEDLYKEISHIDKYFKKYQDKYDKFNQRFNYLDDANSSERVLDEIIKEK
ncbi:MAG: CDP-glycerol glycerophosphotransferase family protein [Bacilli bacterium]|nr:CDP-glycerol glycerophosphotransferase family protein [Bacilli bacterium]